MLRQIETDITTARCAPGFSGEVDDALYLSMLGAYVKKMKKAVVEYRNAGERGQEMVKQLSFEVDYLGRWLPRQPPGASPPGPRLPRAPEINHVFFGIPRRGHWHL